MSFPASYRQTSQTAEQSFVSNSASTLVSALNSINILDGLLIEGIELDTTGISIEHGLGRAWRGWCLVDIDTSATVYRASSEDETVLIKLRASSGTPTVSIWVF